MNNICSRKEISILYIGSLNRWSNSFARFKALRLLHNSVDAIDTDHFLLTPFFSRIQYHFNLGPGIFLLNRRIRSMAKKRYDIVYVDNKSYVFPGTLKWLKFFNPDTQIINVLTDDPFGRYSKHWRLFKKTIPLFDIVFVQRKVNVNDLLERKAKKVEICYRSYDPEFHRPLKLNDADNLKYATQVGFVGAYEADREDFIVYLIKNGINVYITGNGWKEAKHWNIISPFYKGPSVYGEAYIKTINGMDIALHFLRHANRDEQDSRTFEVPACGVFMIAERSPVHEELFKENEEVVFFDTKEELLNKVVLYLNNKSARELMALKALQRCINSGYSHTDRLKSIITCVLNETT